MFLKINKILFEIEQCFSMKTRSNHQFLNSNLKIKHHTLLIQTKTIIINKFATQQIQYVINSLNPCLFIDFVILIYFNTKKVGSNQVPQFFSLKILG